MPSGSHIGPLRGLRVIDATQTPDAIAASTLLADLGADVILFEAAPEGHRSRQVGPRKGDVSLLWKVTGRNKRVVRLSAAVRDPHAWFLQLASRSDVVIVEPASGAGAQPLDAEALLSRLPHLVILSTSPYGSNGPLAGRPGAGRVSEAFGGQTFAAGDPDRSPL